MPATISQYIERDLAGRIETDQDLPAALDVALAFAALRRELDPRARGDPALAGWGNTGSPGQWPARSESSQATAVPGQEQRSRPEAGPPTVSMRSRDAIWRPRSSARA